MKVFIIFLSIGLLGQHLSLGQSQKECDDITSVQGAGYPLELINACALRRTRQNSPGTLSAPCVNEPNCGTQRCVFGFITSASGCRLSCQCSSGEGLYEGDIELTDEVRGFLNANVDIGQPTPAPNPNVQRAAARSIRLWNNIREGSNYVVPYEVSPSIGSRGRLAISAAVRDFEQSTCIRLRPSNRYPGQPRLFLYPGGGCSSPVGRMSNRQQVSLASGCWQKGTVIHEILHSLGFWHEQSRPDRDSHVRINYGNIYRGMGYNFNKLSRQQVNSRNSPYDIGSVMHYNSYAFSSNRQATITDLQGRTLRTQRNGFSREDIKQLNAMYGCRTTGTGGGGTGTGGGGTGTGGGGTGTGGGGTGTGGGGTGTGGGTGGTCRDENAMCARWAGSGECQKNPRYMLKSCCLSCKSGGGGTCADVSTNCPAWARAGECRRNPGYMRPNCCRSCRSTGTTTTTTTRPTSSCTDASRNCPAWSRLGYCTSRVYTQWMATNCRRSCNRCPRG